MASWRRRVERIKTEISIEQVLSDFGYKVRLGDREQQFSCSLHGSGQDNKPSARVYPASASWYCFGCDKSRDAIETVRATITTSEGKPLDFKEAIRWLEAKYNLPTLPWEDEDPKPTKRTTAAEEIERTFNKGLSFDDLLRATKATLRSDTIDRELPMDLLLGLWEAIDGAEFLVKTNQATEEQGRKVLVKAMLKRDEVRNWEMPS